MQDFKSLFSLDENVHYLNCAYMSPSTSKVTEVGVQSVQDKSQPHHYSVDDFFKPVEEVRAKFARLINGEDKNRIAISPSVSYTMSNAANAIKLLKGQKIVMLGGQFPSNVYPWLRLAERDGGKIEFVEEPNADSLSNAWNVAVLSAIDDTTGVVAIPQVHWANGVLFDLPAIGAKARSVGALLAIDGTQSIGAFPFDQKEVQADVIACAAYKWLMGPYGIGCAYYGPYFDDKLPIEEVWMNRQNAQDFKNLVNYEGRYREKSIRFTMGGQSNFILMAMLNQSLDHVLDWGTSVIQEHCADISRSTISDLREAGFSIEPSEGRGHHLFGIGLPNDGISRDHLNQTLRSNQIYCSLRGKYIRVSPHLYNSEADFQALKQVLLKTC